MVKNDINRHNPVSFECADRGRHVIINDVARELAPCGFCGGTQGPVNKSSFPETGCGTSFSSRVGAQWSKSGLVIAHSNAARGCFQLPAALLQLRVHPDPTDSVPVGARRADTRSRRLAGRSSPAQLALLCEVGRGDATEKTATEAISPTAEQPAAQCSLSANWCRSKLVSERARSTRTGPVHIPT